MSVISAPFGLRPALHPSGLDRQVALSGGITSGYATTILKGQPVVFGTVANGGAAGTIIPALATGAATGMFHGVEWTDTTGRRRVSNSWPANTAYIAGSCVAYFYTDPNIVYEIMADGPMAQTTIGNEFMFTNLANGNTSTGLSACTLGAATAVGNGIQGQMRVIDIAPYVDNNYGDNFTIVRVVMSNTQFFGATVAIA